MTPYLLRTARSYQKSRNMEALLTEGRKRRAAKTDKVRAPVAPSEDRPRPKAAPAPAESDSLRALAESVKRKAGDVGGRGKRSRV